MKSAREFCKYGHLANILDKQAKLEVVLKHHRLYTNGKFSTSIPEFEKHPNIKNYSDLYDYSVNNSDEFWRTLAKSRLNWLKEFSTVSDCDISKGKIGWFVDGKLNVAG